MAERDPFAEYDAAYIFGALSVEDRTAYEAHLADCADCRAAIATFAGLPGLLGQVPLERVVDDRGDASAPESLLPRLLDEVARERRRVRTRTMIGGLLAAACVLGALLVAVRSDSRHSDARGQSVSTPSSANAEVPMQVVAATDLRATVAVQSVAWGTKIEMHCTYSNASESPRPYEGSSFQLRVIGRNGTDSVVARWNPVAGKTLAIEGDSQLQRAELSRVQVVDPTGAVLLELAL